MIRKIKRSKKDFLKTYSISAKLKIKNKFEIILGFEKV